MSENAGTAGRHQYQPGVIQDRVDNSASTPASGRSVDILVATPGNQDQGGIASGIPNVSAPSTIPGPSIINSDVGELRRFRTIQKLGSVREEINHGQQFPSPVEKIPVQARSSTAFATRELPTSSLDDSLTTGPTLRGTHEGMHHGHRFLSSTRTPLQAKKKFISSREFLPPSEDDSIRMRLNQCVVRDEMHHGHQFPSSVEKDPLPTEIKAFQAGKNAVQETNNAIHYGELPTSTAGDTSTVLAVGFGSSTYEGNGPQFGQSNQSFGEGKCMRMGNNDNTCMRTNESTNKGVRMHTDENGVLVHTIDFGIPIINNNDGMRTDKCDYVLSIHKNDGNDAPLKTNTNSGMRPNASSDGMRMSTSKGSNRTAIKEHSPQRSRGGYETVASPKRLTRAQKKTKKKWCSKRQGGRMPDGALTTPRGTLL